MFKFATDNKCSLKGIIDYEIAKKRKKREFYIPVYYSSPKRVAASFEATLLTDYRHYAYCLLKLNLRGNYYVLI